MKRNKSSSSDNDIERLDYLANLTLDKLEQLLDFFTIKYQNLGGRIFGACPIHNGRNPHAFNIYVNSGIWQCFTRHCEQKKGKTLIGLVRALLSRDLDKKFISNEELIEFLLKFTQANLSGLRNDPYYKDKKSFAAEFNKTKKIVKGRTDRNYIRSKLVIPAEYYIKRGYSTEVLNEFDVGLCVNEMMPLFKRVVVPIYDKNDLMIGCTARATDNSNPKWQDSANLPKTELLYNFWRASEVIKEKDNIIIVESPGNLWRLWEAGFKNSISLLGSSMSAAQFDMINSLGISRITTIMDGDKAGEEGAASIENMAKKLYKVIQVKLAESPFSGHNDIGELSIAEVQSLLHFFL